MEKKILATGALTVAVMLGSGVTAAQDKAPECEMLFVQNARSVKMDTKTLVLEGVSPLITFFCDRPVRQAGI